MPLKPWLYRKEAEGSEGRVEQRKGRAVVQWCSGAVGMQRPPSAGLAPLAPSESPLQVRDTTPVVAALVSSSCHDQQRRGTFLKGPLTLRVTLHDDVLSRSHSAGCFSRRSTTHPASHTT
eukprot:9502331-Pyramimonas_sp.AAC.2